MIVDALNHWYYLAITAGGAAVGAILIWLIVISKDHYSQSDVEAHASDYGRVIKEGHGPMLPYLWAIFIGVFIIVIVYWVLNWSALPTINTY